MTASLDAAEPLVEARDLSKRFVLRRTIADRFRRIPGEILRAVDGVDLEIRPGESVGLAGESGSGKSVTAELIGRLQRPTSGTLRFRGHDVTGNVDPGLERQFRRAVSMVSQDPYDALNPRMDVAAILAEPLDVHRLGTPAERRVRVEEMLERVRLVPAGEYAEKHPHELSGGERQRVAIGRALMLDPALLIADEPTTMLDVSVRSGLLNLIRGIRAKSNLAVLFISHDFATLRYVCDRIVILYLGKVVETGPTAEVLGRRLHPYTEALCSAIPIPDPRNRRSRTPNRTVAMGLPPADGCPFAPRCPLVEARCREEMPPLVEQAPGHRLACHVVSRSGVAAAAVIAAQDGGTRREGVDAQP